MPTPCYLPWESRFFEQSCLPPNCIPWHSDRSFHPVPDCPVIIQWEQLLFDHDNRSITRELITPVLDLSEEMRTDKKEFYIRKVGDTFIAYPTDDPWAPVRQVIGTFPLEFMADRNQPSWEEVPSREDL